MFDQDGQDGSYIAGAGLFIRRNYEDARARETREGERWPPLPFACKSVVRVVILYINRRLVLTPTYPSHKLTCQIWVDIGHVLLHFVVLSCSITYIVQRKQFRKEQFLKRSIHVEEKNGKPYKSNRTAE